MDIGAALRGAAPSASGNSQRLAKELVEECKKAQEAEARFLREQKLRAELMAACATKLQEKDSEISRLRKHIELNGNGNGNGNQIFTPTQSAQMQHTFSGNGVFISHEEAVEAKRRYNEAINEATGLQHVAEWLQENGPLSGSLMDIVRYYKDLHERERTFRELAEGKLGQLEELKGTVTDLRRYIKNETSPTTELKRLERQLNEAPNERNAVRFHLANEQKERDGMVAAERVTLQQEIGQIQGLTVDYQRDLKLKNDSIKGLQRSLDTANKEKVGLRVDLNRPIKTAEKFQEERDILKARLSSAGLKSTDIQTQDKVPQPINVQGFTSSSLPEPSTCLREKLMTTLTKTKDIAVNFYPSIVSKNFLLAIIGFTAISILYTSIQTDVGAQYEGMALLNRLYDVRGSFVIRKLYVSKIAREI